MLLVDWPGWWLGHPSGEGFSANSTRSRRIEVRRIVVALLLASSLVLGCQGESGAPTTIVGELEQVQYQEFPGVREVWNAKRAEQGLWAGKTNAEMTAPSPLPSVSYDIGEVRGSGTVRLPVYMNSAGLRSQGGLLFLEYDAKHMQFVGVEPGPAWANADFVHESVNDMVPGHAIFLILGWELNPDGGAYGIPPSEEPWAYVVFEAKQPGKAKVQWDTLPDLLPCYTGPSGTQCFVRRGEMLLDLDDLGRDVWDVLDYYTRNGINTTGTLTVQPGAVKVGPSLD